MIFPDTVPISTYPENSLMFSLIMSANANVFHKVKQIELLCVTMHVHTRMCVHIQIHKSQTLSIKHYVSRQNNHIYSPLKIVCPYIFIKQ